ncbi:MAG TPA: DUF2267 domain-containing protein [Labilithrix sp.]|nr:DUF2267 domain-containing protein [Labilithrix sp.]
MAEVQPVSQRTARAEPSSTDETGFLLEDIQRHAPLPPNITPQEAIRAVMCTFSQHLSGGEARHVFEALPKAVHSLLDRCMVHRGEHAERFDRDELVFRVSEHLGVALEQAEELTSAVLHAISKRLPAGTVADVAAQLPRDMQDLWVVPKLPVGIPVEPHPILGRIEQSVQLPQGVTGIGAFTAVMSHLSRRLTLGETRHLCTALPADLRQLLEPSLYGRGEHPEKFNKTEFLERVARDLKMANPSDAEVVARTVFRYVEEYIPAKPFKDVCVQLPRELSDLWALP